MLLNLKPKVANKNGSKWQIEQNEAKILSIKRIRLHFFSFQMNIFA